MNHRLSPHQVFGILELLYEQYPDAVLRWCCCLSEKRGDDVLEVKA